jgi:hypothetical protein
MTTNLHHRLQRLRNLASAFRLALENQRKALPDPMQDFPRGACGDASLLLGKYLKDQGEGTAEYVWGTDGNQSLGWLELDGIKIDITADQFEGCCDPVLVTTDSTRHSRFTDQSRDDVRLDESLSAVYQELFRGP